MVEMLVVVFIIAALISLLLPAIIAARESGRAAQCANNQQELGKALIHYEGIKQHLPGVLSLVNPNNPTPVVNWVMSTFGEMGRMDLWQIYYSNPASPPVKVAQLICPSNSLVEPVGGLSYVVNLGGYLPPDANGNPVYDQRLFLNRTCEKPNPEKTFSSFKSTARTVMLSERLVAGPWNYTIAPTVAGDFTPLLPLAFPWPFNPTPPFSTTTPYNFPPKINEMPYPGLSSNHRGMIIMTFFDGHSEKVPDTTYTWFDPDNQLYGTP